MPSHKQKEKPTRMKDILDIIGQIEDQRNAPNSGPNPQNFYPPRENPQEGSSQSLPREDECKVLGITDHILKHLPDRLSIDRLAFQSGLNKSKLQTGFKTLYGVTVSEFIAVNRIEKSKEILLTTKLPIAEIARKVGYSKPQFLRVFKRLMNMRPTYFRNNFRS